MSQEDLPNDVQQLQALLLQAQSELVEMSSTVQEQRRELDKKDQKIADLLAAMRGKKRERIDPNQLLMFDLEELQQVVDEAESEPPARRRRRGHGRRRLPADLPREVRTYELPEAERLCPHDGRPMELIGYETSEQLEFVPAKLSVIEHRRAKYACRLKHDAAKLVKAPKPPQPIDRGLPGPGLLAAMVVGKFGDHLPVYRLEDILSRHGVEVRRSTIYGWLAAAADLCESLVSDLRQQVLASRIVHTDDTSVKLIDIEAGGTSTARFWAYSGDRKHPYTVYDFTETRQRDGPQKFLDGYRGYLQADAYGGYDGLYLQSAGDIVEVACWAHCRRYWWKAREQDPVRAHHVMGVITRLYAIERSAADHEPAARQSLRAEHAGPLLAELGGWLREQRDHVLPQSLIGKAFTYTLNQWDALQRYLEDGDLAIDNNLSERMMKPVAIGRKNWLFVGSPVAGRRAATLMSLLASCKFNHVEPWAYLRDLFERLPDGASVSEFRPDQWLAAHPQHRWHIAEVRRDERRAKGSL